MKKTHYHHLFPTLVGLLLGLLQTGLFFQLSLSMSSGFMTYLLITLCWLLGSVIGVRYVAPTFVSQRAMLVLMMVSFFLIGFMVNAQPFNTQFVPLYGGLTILAGLYPGIFFARLSETYTARLLFFWENNGFILGMVSTTLLFMIVGRIIVILLPLCLAVIVWWYSDSMANRPDVG